MKTLLMAGTMIVALTVGAFGQQGRAVGGQRSGPVTSLKTVLNLTDAQVSAIQSIIQTTQQQSKAVVTDLNQKRQVLNTLLNASSPNPTDVGNAALAVHAGEAQLQVLRTNQIANIRNTLTSDQQAAFDTLVKARLPIPGVGPGFGPRGMRPPGGLQ